MPDPVVVPRAGHRISRRDIDPEALKVLYRLHEHKFAAYLVGGSVRDLLLGRRPKDFDVGTDAHPYQIKKLFRNCWIIGRRFRLAHVKFGPKTIEVATFRRLVPDTEPLPEPEAVVVATTGPDDPSPTDQPTPEAPPIAAHDDHGIIHRDNTFGTPEEDAFRRDFTINGLFYDIGTYSVIDYVGGLEDLDKRLVRSIGDPRVRFVEDPVRMIRAVVMASRLGFDMDALVIEALAEHRTLIQQASPARLLEEYYKILRSGCAETTFRGLARTRLLELLTPELKSPPAAVWDSLARLDQFRQRTPDVPPELTNTLLIGALLVPLGAVHRRPPGRAPEQGHPERISFGMLPVARRDLERLQHLLTTLPRLTEPNLPPRVVRGLVLRPSFADALAWLSVFGDDPDLVARWRQLFDEAAAERREHERRRTSGRHGSQGAHGHHRHEAHEAHEPRTPAHGDPSPQGPGDRDPAAEGRPRRRRRRRRRRGGGARPPQS